jgi:hypothetical protein
LSVIINQLPLGLGVPEHHSDNRITLKHWPYTGDQQPWTNISLCTPFFRFELYSPSRHLFFQLTPWNS